MRRFRKKSHILSLMLVLILLVQVTLGEPASFPSYGQTGTVITDRLNLRTGPGTSYSSAGMLSTNAKVNVIKSVTGTDGYVWYQVSCTSGSGYLRSDFVNLDLTYNSADTDFEAYLNSQGFPESYKNALRGLHQKYPNWVFIAQKTGLDWDEVIQKESKIGLNLVYTDNISSWKSTEEGAFDWASNYWPGFDGSVWVAASRGIISHYMDPRNFLTDPYIFQFQVQSYDSSIQTREGLEQMVQGTFLSGTAGEKITGSSGYGPGYVSTGSDNSTSEKQNSNDTSIIGPVAETENKLGESLFLLFGGMKAEANWQKQEDHWIYLNEDGSKNVNGWFWLDGNKDGISECYYFDGNGIMASDTTIGDYTVNKDGQWVKDGAIQTRTDSTSVSTAGNSSGSDAVTYVDLIMEAAEKSGVSPYVLAAMIIQEQGKDGDSPLISGTNSSYYGYYNFYNIGAYEHDGMSAVEAGLKYASESGNGNRPWNTVEKGIVGGAVAYGANFVDNGQDTFYLKKFNVQGDNKYNHQYMTNVVAAAQEGAKISDAYSEQIKNSALTFRIPVYNNMPESNCEVPTVNGNPNNKLSGLQVDGFSLTPTFHMNTTEYTLIVDSSVSSVNISASTIDSHTSVSGAGTRQLGEGLNEISIVVTAESGDVRTYRLSITRKQGGSVSSEFGPGSSTVSGSDTDSIGPSTGNTETVSVSQGTGNASADGHESVIEICGPPM